MSTTPVALLRQRAPSLYSEFLPADLSYRNAAGHTEIVALESATVDELAFAIQTLHREASVITRQRSSWGSDRGPGGLASTPNPIAPVTSRCW